MPPIAASDQDPAGLAVETAIIVFAAEDLSAVARWLRKELCAHAVAADLRAV